MLELKTYKTRFATGELFTVTEINRVKVKDVEKIVSIYGFYEKSPHLERCPINIDRLIIDEKEHNQYDNLPKFIKTEMVKRHTHAELLQPDEIVYKEKDVIELINIVKKS